MTAIYDVEDYDPRKSVGYLVNRVRSEVLSALDHEFATDTEIAPLEVTAAQYIILSGLLQRDTDSTSRLCKEMSYDPGAMTRMVDRLEAKGLVVRKRCPDDRRLVNIELTEAGRAAVPKMRACSVAVLNRLLRGFSPEEVQQFEGFLNRMVSNT
jgi:DNA-binding MarR family transcriptional regulator